MLPSLAVADARSSAQAVSNVPRGRIVNSMTAAIRAAKIFFFMCSSPLLSFYIFRAEGLPDNRIHHFARQVKGERQKYLSTISIHTGTDTMASTVENSTPPALAKCAFSSGSYFRLYGASNSPQGMVQ